MDDCFEMRGSFEEEFDLVFEEEEEGLKESALIIIRYAAEGRNSQRRRRRRNKRKRKETGDEIHCHLPNAVEKITSIELTWIFTLPLDLSSNLEWDCFYTQWVWE